MLRLDIMKHMYDMLTSEHNNVEYAGVKLLHDIAKLTVRPFARNITLVKAVIHIVGSTVGLWLIEVQFQSCSKFKVNNLQGDPETKWQAIAVLSAIAADGEGPEFYYVCNPDYVNALCDYLPEAVGAAKISKVLQGMRGILTVRKCFHKAHCENYS